MSNIGHHCLSQIEFTIDDKMEDIIKDVENKHLLQYLGEPAELRRVCLWSNYHEGKSRILDFTGLTVFEVIQRVLLFYKHKTYNRLMGDHRFFQGFYRCKEGELPILSLGS